MPEPTASPRVHICIRQKGIVHPRPCHARPEEASSSLSLTSVLDGCRCPTPRLARLYPRERYPASFVKEAGRTSGQVWTGTEDLAPTGIRSPDSPANSESFIRFIEYVGTDLQNVTLVWTPEQRADCVCDGIARCLPSCCVATDRGVRVWSSLRLRATMSCIGRVYSVLGKVKLDSIVPTVHK